MNTTETDPWSVCPSPNFYILGMKCNCYCVLTLLNGCLNWQCILYIHYTQHSVTECNGIERQKGPSASRLEIRLENITDGFSFQFTQVHALNLLFHPSPSYITIPGIWSSDQGCNLSSATGDWPTWPLSISHYRRHAISSYRIGSCGNVLL